MIMGGIAGLNALVTFPILFHLFVIPRLEKTLEMKLEFKRPDYSARNRIWRRFAGVPMDVGLYISIKYLLLILRRDTLKIKIRPYSSLQKINFPVQDASKIGIILSLLFLINLVTLCTMTILAYIYKWDEIRPYLLKSIMHTRHHW